MPELRPCPFCGGKAFFDKLYDGGVEEHCIACTDCDCVFTVTYKNPDKDDLIEAWNRRMSDENA